MGEYSPEDSPSFLKDKSYITLESMVLEYSRSALKNLIDEAVKSPITIETIIAPFNFDSLVSVKKQQRMHNDVSRMIEDFKKKALPRFKDRYTEEGLSYVVDKLYNAEFFLTYLNTVISLVLDNFGIVGHGRLTYYNLSRSVASKMTKIELYDMPKFIQAKITQYVTEYMCSEEVAKAVAIISAKVTYFFMKQNARIW